MPIINVLPKNIAELIAAGEVIERPSSVIKELVENSIDAGADSITVEIQRGGVTYMRVSDNGCGIEREDVKKAFLRHATSKISKANDLDSIGTLGFRGEALASICAVSRTEIITKNIKDETGTRYAIEGGEETAFEPAGCPTGTTFIVRDIFYNVPARMKFLKKDVTEGNAISTLMDRIALSHPEISFTFIRDGKQTLRTQGDGRLSTAVYQVFGRSFFDSLIEVNYELGGIKVEGYVTKPLSSVKANRSMQMFYINGRYVRTKTGMAALEQAYRGSLMTGKYPSCILCLTMNCSMLDVNVHPAKLEVRFTDESPVYESIYHAVRSAVAGFDPRNDSLDKPEPADPRLFSSPADRATQQGFSFGTSVLPSGKVTGSKAQTDPPARVSDIGVASAAPAHPFSTVFGGTIPRAPAPRRYGGSIDIFVEDEEAPARTEAKPAAPKEEPTPKAAPDLPSFPDVMTDTEEQTDTIPEDNAAVPAENGTENTVTAAKMPAEEQSDPLIVDIDDMPKPFKYIGQVFSTYIILEYDSTRLMFIDKHAAHERLLYEKLKRGGAAKETQYLLEPVSVSFDPEECRIVTENREALLGAGFEVDPFGDRTVLVRSIPVFMEKLDVAEEFEEIADYLHRHKKVVLSEKMDWIIANTACRAAIKAGNVSTDDELIELAMELERNPEIRTCPHGRPIYFLMTKYELEKAFKRIV